MNKIILTGIAVILFAACNNRTATNNGQSDTVSAVTDSAHAAVMTFENTTYNFGNITEGQKVTYDFKFKNTGESPLVILNALASCGCTVPDYPRNPLPPGKEGVINVVFNSEGKSGVQEKVITLTANTIPSTTQLYLKGEVKKAKTK
jgi:hypothetical protein